MKVLFDNVNPGSSSGPNSFGRKLMNELQRQGHEASVELKEPDAQLSFISINRRLASKIALRLDGIYFNTRQDWNAMNTPIKASHDLADLVIYQSNFNKRLTEKYFGSSKKSVVIGNGTSLDDINRIEKIQHARLDSFSEIWCCSSSWRPHKRLKSNVEYFLEMRTASAGLIVLGENPDYVINDPNILYVGKQSWETCISIYKRCKKFIHLAFLDHCPNVVVDARASGCEIVVAGSGGTREIAGPNAIVVKDVEWDLRPLDLYSPPLLNPADSFLNKIESSIDIGQVALRYIDAIESMVRGNNEETDP